MGTPDFAVPSLAALVENGQEILAVVTQPDRPKGRGQKLAFPPVKEKALEYGINVYQPENINTSEFKAFLRELEPDLIVVVAFGQLLGTEVLTLPRLGCLNVHASLLPKYRGAAPIHRAIMDGEQETGVTIMYMTEELDAGDMLLRERVDIEEEDTLGLMHDKLAKLGGKALIKAVDALEQIPRIVQDHSQATYAAKIAKKDVEISWQDSASKIKNLVRGANPWPGAYTYCNNKLWKVWQVSIETERTQGKPGELSVEGNKLLVGTGKGTIRLEEIQPENSKRMKAGDYLQGHVIDDGSFLGR